MSTYTETRSQLVPGTWQVSDRQMVRTDSETFSFSSSPVADESNVNFNAPDYLIDLSSLVSHRLPLRDGLRSFELIERGEAVKVLVIPES